MTNEEMKAAAQDSAKFSNFCQKIKMQLWERMGDMGDTMPHIAEKWLDEILLMAWREFHDK